MSTLMCLWIAAWPISAPRTTTPTASAPHRPAPPPAVAAVDQAFLTETARREIVAAVTGSRRDDASYVPPALREIRCRAFVTLREDGVLLAGGQSDGEAVVPGVVTAAQRAVRALAAKGRTLSAAQAQRCALEIELLGDDERVGTGADSPEELAAWYEPGFEGIRAHVGARDVFIRPSQLLSREPVCEGDGGSWSACNPYRVSIASLLAAVGPSPPSGPDAGLDLPARIEVPPQRVEFYRYRTRHFWQARQGLRPVELVCGLRRVGEDEVTPNRIDEAVRHTAEYIRYRQRPEGFFAHEYLPGRDRYIRENGGWDRQAGTIWSLAAYARATGDDAARRAADRAIEAMRRMVRPRPGYDRTAFVATPDGRDKLSTTALFGLALLDVPEPERYAELVTLLGEAVRSLQLPDGRFRVRFASKVETLVEREQSPGAAVLFLARLYDRYREPRWREGLDRALPFSRQHHRESAGPAFAAWQIQAYGRLARSTTLSRYAEFVLEMADRLAATQLDAAVPSEGVWPEVAQLCDGGLDAVGAGRAGIATALYVTGLVEAAQTARAFGDATRAGHYQDVIRRATRFLLQLQFKPEEAYFVRSPRDAVYGFRVSPIDNTLRIDYTQQAWVALRAAREMLWP